MKKAEVETFLPDSKLNDQNRVLSWYMVARLNC